MSTAFVNLDSHQANCLTDLIKYVMIMLADSDPVRLKGGGERHRAYRDLFADLTAAASSALFLPLDTPTPNMAVPELHMIAFTSAKSTLTSPGMVMISEMPWTPWSQHNAHEARGRKCMKDVFCQFALNACSANQEQLKHSDDCRWQPRRLLMIVACKDRWNLSLKMWDGGKPVGGRHPPRGRHLEGA